MNIVETPIKNLLIITPAKYNDSRGHFFEQFHAERYEQVFGTDILFVQDNVSKSKKNVLRGLHFQHNYPQGKLVSVLQGSIYDVAVDLRKESVKLTDKDYKQFWIPEGFAHGFLSLEDNTIVHYKCTNFYDPKSEETMMWNDSALNINWPISAPILSKKDLEGISSDKYLTHVR
jgi:dTDP-4-dehydrorhamnose 3,5-epimerase